MTTNSKIPQFKDWILENKNIQKLAESNEEIVSATQAADIISEMFRQNGFKATKLKNNGYYSFAVRDIHYGSKIKSFIEKDSRFKFKEVNSYLEYSIEVPSIEIKFKLKYESTRTASILVLNLDLS